MFLIYTTKISRLSFYLFVMSGEWRTWRTCLALHMKCCYYTNQFSCIYANYYYFGCGLCSLHFLESLYDKIKRQLKLFNTFVQQPKN